MKKLLHGLAILWSLISLCSCSKTIFTHQQVMQSYHTREAVVKQFGYPDERREKNGITEWLYSCDKASGFINSHTKVGINGKYNPVNGAVDSIDNHSAVVAQFTPYKHYIKFAFDKKGQVLGYDSHGVNYAEKKKNTVGTVFLVVGLTAAALVVAAGITLEIALANWSGL